MLITDYEAEVKLNSDEILDWTSFSVSQSMGKGEPRFNVELNRPISTSDGDTITISDGFEDVLVPLISSKEIESHHGSAARRSLVGGGTKIAKKAPLKDIYYVNKTWLDLIAPGNVVEDGIIYRCDPGDDSWQVQGVSQLRLFVTGLPGKNVKDHEFECIVEPGVTYHDIVKDMASLCGLSCVINTPNLSVQKTLSISSGERYWSVIPRLVAKWRPRMFVKDDTLYVLDCMGDTRAKPSDKHIALTEDSFSIFEWGVSDEGEEIDHVVIFGPNTNYSYQATTVSVRMPSRSAKRLPGAEVIEQREETRYSEKEDDITLLLNMDTASQRPYKRVTTLTKKIDPRNANNRVTIQEKITTYNLGDEKINEIITDYEYADFDTPVGRTEKEYSRVIVIAGGYTETLSTVGGVNIMQLIPQWEWRQIREREVVFRDYFSEVGAVEVDDITYEYCAVFKSRQLINGEYYYSFNSCQPIRKAMLANYDIGESESNGEVWEAKWMVTLVDTIRFDKASPSLLRKTRTRTNMVPTRVIETFTEDVPIPVRRRSGTLEKRWEYFKVSELPQLYEGGTLPTGEYHPKITLYEPDVVTQEDAYKIAQRLMSSKREGNTFGVIETTLPVLGVIVGGTITLPEFERKVVNWSTSQYEIVTVPSKTYWIVSHTRVCQYTGPIERSQRQFRAFDRIEIKEYF